MMSYEVNLASIRRDFCMGDLRDNSSVEHIHELINILGVSVVPELTFFLINLTGLCILSIVDQDSWILLEGILGMKMS